MQTVRHHGILLLIPLMLLALAAPVLAQAGTVTFYVENPTFQGEVYTVVFNDTVALNGTSTAPDTFNISIPQQGQKVIVRVDNASASATLEALDASGNSLFSASIVPLSSGLSLELPGDTATVKLVANNAWSGSITVTVVDLVQFTLLSVTPSSIEIAPGGAKTVTLNFRQESGQAGYAWLMLNEQDTPNAGYFTLVSDPDNDGVFYVATPGAGGTFSIQAEIQVSRYAQPGQYRLYIDALWSDVPPQSASDYDVRQTVLVATVDLAADGSGTATFDSADQGVDWKWFGVGAVVVLGLVFIAASGKGGRGGRRGVSPLLAALIIMAVAALAFGLFDFNPQFNVDWKWLGIGAIAALFLLLLTRPAMVRQATRRLGL